MKGLLVFISAIRNCGSKEAETKQINKELANIRFNFKGDKTLSGYQKKKYVCKLLFIFLLGHDIDFGHNEAVNLLICSRFSEKQIGYMFISVLSFENHPLMNLIHTRLKEDLHSSNPYFANLALQCMSHIATAEMVETFASDVMKMLVSSDTIPNIKQSAALCLVAFFRILPNFPIPSDWKTSVVQLLFDHNMGVSMSAVSLIDVLAKKDPNGFKSAYSPCVSRLDSLHSSKYTDLQDYTYYFVPSPWFTVKLLQCLINYPAPLDPIDRNRLFTILDTILATAQESPKSKKVQHSNAKSALIFEAVTLITSMDCSPKQVAQACTQMGEFLQHKEANHRYLALESLCQFATSGHGHEAVKQHKDTVISELKSEQDISVRQRAVDLLYAMCDRTNAESIVTEMLAYLDIAEPAFREELVLKVAILAEKYAPDHQWYVDVMLNLIRIAGDFVIQDVWHRVIQIVVNQESVQGYAAKMVFEAVQAPACHENMIKVGAFILGEFGNLIAGDPDSSPEQQFYSLHNKFGLCSPTTRQMLLSTYVKFVNLFPELKPTIETVFSSDSVKRSSNIEIQQRALEYISLCRNANNGFLATIFEEMPPFPNRESNILAKLKSKNVNSDLNRAERSANDTPTMNAGTINAMRNGTSPADALGSNVPASAADNAGQNVLVDLLGDEQSSNLFASPQSSVEVVTRKEIHHLLCKPGAALLDNNVIQIGYHLQKNQNMARMTLFYGNKSSQPLINFSTHVEWDGISSPDQMSSYVQNELQPCDSSIECGIQVQQLLNVMACEPFTQTMDLMVSFYTNGKQHQYILTLPITLSLFLQPNQMSKDQYLARWQGLTQPEQECAQEFRSVHPFDTTTVRSKLLASGLSVLDGIDPNVHNFVGAAIFPGRARQYGILYRLEPYPSSQTYRLTVRGTHPVLAKRLNHILRMQL